LISEPDAKKIVVEALKFAFKKTDLEVTTVEKHKVETEPIP
jgi:hypothetical protein